MKQKRRSSDQIFSKLRKADVELGKGKKVPKFCKELDVAEQTYYRWRQKVGGTQPEMVKQLKTLEKESARLERECSVEEVGGRSGTRHGDPQRSSDGKLVSLERRRCTFTEVRRRLGH